ncbi:hypothetical protein [Photobacterium leiognathi]|uniref:hypothetical protein n=1 Tax=Photobacterium leiognathi TaxID=553611 RepID=UPI000D15FDC8|nr:hypothetical protein [Photobacterium leiognathi]PSW53487.1 hypothetical protein C0W50_19430 [Photobacterium leiognathi subsp. mandapamensis]
MGKLLENEFLSVTISLVVALCVCHIVQQFLLKVFQPKGLAWVFILLASICIFLVASTFSPNESYFYWFISSAKWAMVGIAGLAIREIQEK